MKIHINLIYLFSVFLTAVLLNVSTGITLITHDCTSCGRYSADSGLFPYAYDTEDNCCDAGGKNDPANPLPVLDKKCCNILIERLELTEYTLEKQDRISTPALYQAVLNIAVYPVAAEKTIIHKEGHNKYNGRFLTIFTCRYNS